MKNWPWLVLSIVVIALDQLTKYWAITRLAYQPVSILPGLDFTLAFNTGAAFSFLADLGGWQRWFFASFSLVISVALIIWLIRLPKQALLQCLAISLILGGALGNLYDRLFLGHVIDFIHLYYEQYHWPIFNLADSAVCLGAFFLMVDLVKNKK